MTSPSLRVAVAAQVRAELARARISGSALARATGKSQSYWARRLSGRVPLDVDDLEVVAAVVGVRITALLPTEQ